MDALKIEKEENELVRLKIQREHQRVVKDFEEREGKIEVLEANLEAEKIVTDQ